jgi:hypothetical protein
MIKIIEKPIGYKATCRKCGTKFTYEKEDLMCGCYTEYVLCPTCRENITHSVERNAIYKELQNER